MADTARIFARVATTVSEWSARPPVFAAAAGLIVLWGASGAFFNWSSGWLTVAGTVTALITFLMVFLLQNAQMRDTRAIQMKLDELILTSRAENRFIGIESLHEGDLERLRDLLAKASSGEDGARDGMFREVARHVRQAVKRDPARNAPAGSPE